MFYLKSDSLTKQQNLSKLDFVYLSIQTQIPEKQKLIYSFKVLIGNFPLCKRIYSKNNLFWSLPLLSDSQ